jgi:hypothetical protein
MKDQDKIIPALIELGKLRFKNNKSEYELGVGNMAETMLNILTQHGNSFEYRSNLNQLVEMARNSKINGEKNT